MGYAIQLSTAFQIRGTAWTALPMRSNSPQHQAQKAQVQVLRRSVCALHRAHTVMSAAMPSAAAKDTVSPRTINWTYMGAYR